MIFLLPLLVLAAANPCPYCKWNACEFTQTGLPQCTACYDIAALIPLKIGNSNNSTNSTDSEDIQEVADLGVCQLCPAHCGQCQFVIADLPENGTRPIINCTRCYPGFVTNHFTGKCQSCPSNCNSCQFAVISPDNSTMVGVMSCTDCQEGYIQDPSTGECMQDTQGNRSLIELGQQPVRGLFNEDYFLD